ncbi:CDP-diacylglycerol--serine O-phosphatidyltransferase [Kibdelosporangium banguiense]|uniref:CDP-diacylglycerol--serine O-phosphatidyltransferase n=1 Tax=Kibdelosporangium banguiense TaxID=1365924 RepID=A0ABS4TA20_9PSEU|nr:CDP-diacylglycerol--serine O-phosphatidyltransferase [Kibdelosporangium banguiense]MBP2321253.1 CDP-diacylglycerol--serine O-phosphatidyltransferase [Kibdelosporangium banguiense]
MAARTAPGVRLLPNAITVLAMCAGLSAVQFALHDNYRAVLASIFAAAILDSLDGRIARLLDATSKLGAELDSLSDAIAFGVAPALVLYQWKLGEENNRLGWIFALVFAVCMILRLARFNTLLDDTNQPPYAKEFFVGVPAPAGGMLALLPVVIWLEFEAEGWWTNQIVVMVWTVAVAALLVSRIPTLSVKTVRVPPRMVVPLLVGVTLLAAAVVTYPVAALGIFLIVYLLHIPYAVRRKHWLANHPEAWDVPPRERRAIRSQTRRLGIRPPQLRRRVAGVARRVRLSRRSDENEPMHAGWQSYLPPEQHPRVIGPLPKRRSWRRIGLRRNPRPPRSDR